MVIIIINYYTIHYILSLIIILINDYCTLFNTVDYCFHSAFLNNIFIDGIQKRFNSKRSQIFSTEVSIRPTHCESHKNNRTCKLIECYVTIQQTATG